MTSDRYRDDDDAQADYLACWAMERLERRNNRLLIQWALQVTLHQKLSILLDALRA